MYIDIHLKQNILFINIEYSISNGNLIYFQTNENQNNVIKNSKNTKAKFHKKKINQ